MKSLPLIAALTLTALPASAETLTGTWRTQTYNGEYAYVRFGPCGDKVCGVITHTFDENGEIQGGSLGKTLVINMQPQGGGEYAGGRIRRPDTGQSAPLKLQVNGGTLAMSACIGPICRKETWRSVR